MKKIIAVVVTYNRKILLLECINAILNQTLPVDKIVIIDNCSTDGTYDLVKGENLIDNPKIIYKILETNTGGAGGFYEGIKESIKYNSDWIWIMDDDTIPKNDCLEKLINASNIIKDKISYLASTIYGNNGEAMNTPKINTELSKSGYADWYRYLKDGIIKIREATFVSILINSQIIDVVGLPFKEYFIWGDDIEYTLRMNKYFGNSYMVGDSIAIHKRSSAKALSLKDEESITRINFYYYLIRNCLINLRNYYGVIPCIKYLISNEIESIKILFGKNIKHKWKKVSVIHKGIVSYIFKNYDYKAFKNRLDKNVIYKNKMKGSK